MRQLQLQRAIELSSTSREGTPKAIPLSRDQLDGDFVISAITEGYRFKETEEGLFLVKDETYLALVVHPKANRSGDLQESVLGSDSIQQSVNCTDGPNWGARDGAGDLFSCRSNRIRRQAGEGPGTRIKCFDLKPQLLKHAGIEVTKGRRVFGIERQVLPVIKSATGEKNR